MPPFLLLLVILAVAAEMTEPEPVLLDLDLPAATECWGDPRPVEEEVLVRIVARYGIELEREDACDGISIEPSAMYTNITAEDWDKPEADVVFASDGQVWCDLYRSKRFGRELDRRRVDDEVVFQVLNVECRIYESNAWQVERLDKAMHQLARQG